MSSKIIKHTNRESNDMQEKDVKEDECFNEWTYGVQTNCECFVYFFFFSSFHKKTIKLTDWHIHNSG